MSLYHQYLGSNENKCIVSDLFNAGHRITETYLSLLKWIYVTLKNLVLITKILVDPPSEIN